MAWLKNNFQFELTDTLSVSWMSVRISNEKESGTAAVFTNQYITVRSEDYSVVERMKGSATGGILTLTKRWLDQTDVDVENPALKKEWKEGTKAFITVVASQVAVLDSANTWTWTQTFSEANITNLTVTGKSNPQPNFATIWARDAFYTAPVNGDKCTVAWVDYSYNGTTVQREAKWVSTPVPPASETVSWTTRYATQSEVTNKSAVDAAVKPNQIPNPKALYDDNYIAWEDILANDSLFVENMVTFAEATQVQNIWDVTANTRVSIPVIWSGISSNILKLAIRKFWTPSADLSVKIETDNSGNPSWTAVSNGTTTILASSITTSLVDTTITLLWNVTLTLWTKYHIVLNQVGDVLNVSNYYGIWFSNKNTNIRNLKRYNGSVWSTIINTTVNDSHSFWSSFSSTVSTQEWFRCSAAKNIFLQSVTKDTFSLCTRAILKDVIWSVITTANFVWNVATFSTPILFTQWTQFRIECDANWAGYNRVWWNWYSYPTNRTNINYLNWSIWWIDQSNLASSILTISSTEQSPSDSIFYVNSTIFQSKLLWKADAKFVYKLPTNYVRLSLSNYNTWENVIATKLWLHNYSWLIDNTIYYQSNTPWLISAVAGTNSYIIWNTIDNEELNIDWKAINIPITQWASPFTRINTTWKSVNIKVTWWTVSNIVIDWLSRATATNFIGTVWVWQSAVITYSWLPTVTYTQL